MKHKGLTYQRRVNDNSQNSHDRLASKLPHQKMDPSSSSTDLNIDLDGWLSNAKMLVPITKIVKICSQRQKLLKFI